MNDMNRQVRYDEFTAIMRQGLIEFADTPEARFDRERNKLDPIWPDRGTEDYLQSSDEEENKEPDVEDVKVYC